MYRSVAVRAAQLSGRRLQSTVAVPAGTRVEQTFVDLPQDEQRKTILQLNEVMKQDWTKITMEDKRARCWKRHQLPPLQLGLETCSRRVAGAAAISGESRAGWVEWLHQSRPTRRGGCGPVRKQA
ncbi:hypothetical protein GGI04_003120 [Coemansia thaxteri]|nr:hypothetical protein GGI04_003120 [Coemansia thaxteri]